MPEDQRANGAEREVEVKVNDRRRFTPDGEPIAREEAAPEGDAAPAQGEGAPAGAAAEPDPRDAEAAGLRARVDELTRAYAAHVEEAKAARARMEREKARVIDAERAGVAQALLDAVDELERALAAAGDAPGPLVDGVRLTLASLAKRVGELGAQRIPVLGERFDPRVAEAIDLVPVDDVSQDDVVVQEVRAGYRIGDRILRPARVRVGRAARA